MFGFLSVFDIVAIIGYGYVGVVVGYAEAKTGEGILWSAFKGLTWGVTIVNTVNKALHSKPRVSV